MLYVHVDLEQTLKAVKAWLRAMQRRPDVVVTRACVGPKLRHAALEPYRRQSYDYPVALLGFYFYADGLDIAWEFADGQPGGRLYLPPLREAARLHDTGLPWPAGGPGQPPVPAGHWRGRLLDEVAPGRGTWLLADSAAPGVSTYLAYRDEAADVVRWLPYNLAEYLLQALARGFVPGWPLAAPDAPVPAALARLARQPPGAGHLRPGGRVNHPGDGGQPYRGEILETWPAASPAPSHARVRLDLGQTLWLVSTRLKLVPTGPDLYEQYRADPWQLVRLGEAAGWPAAVRHMALLWGPVVNVSYAGYRHGSPALLGLLLPLPLPEAVAWAQAVVAGLEAARPALPEPLVPTEAERQQAHDPAGWQREGGRCSWPGLVYPLLSALLGRVLAAPAAERARVAGAALDHLEATNRTHYWGPPAEFAGLRAALAGQPLPAGAPSQPLTAFAPAPPHPAQARHPGWG